MSNEIYYITRISGGSGIYEITKTSAGIQIYGLSRPDSKLPPEGGGGGGRADVSYSWSLHGNFQWNGGYASTSWTTVLGSYTGYGNIITISNPAFSHVAVATIAGADGYWQNDSGSCYGSMGVKTGIEYRLLGSGSVQINAAGAITDWLSADSVILQLGSDRKVAFGFNTNPGVKTCVYSVYFGYVI